MGHVGFLLIEFGLFLGDVSLQRHVAAAVGLCVQQVEEVALERLKLLLDGGQVSVQLLSKLLQLPAFLLQGRVQIRHLVYFQLEVLLLQDQ